MTGFTLTLSSLAGRTGRGVRIAIVDSGVHAEHPHVGGISGGVAIDESGAFTGDVVDRLGHGTAVAAAIREKAPDAELFAVKVFDRALATTGRTLVDAIRWAAGERVQIINLSLGTRNQDHAAALTAAVQYALANGALVVSPAPQPDAAWLPGGIGGVIGVEVDWNSPRDTCVVHRDEHARMRITASAYPRPIPGVPPERNLRGLSFAVANATGFLALVLEGHTLSGAVSLAGILENAARQSS